MDTTFKANLNGREEKVWAMDKDIMVKLAEVSKMEKYYPQDSFFLLDSAILQLNLLAWNIFNLWLLFVSGSGLEN